ncbi:carbonic anhydrase [Leucogyrophana mollusca]|uniref:Carbonic anhydrase n=1 Tax=Leucogyrophana mollusca TaxID=85980 RepID=A0ACB8BQ20_9AGAM|nr:carbonic anhydrase [Leucogyrophana mollusca]
MSHHHHSVLSHLLSANSQWADKVAQAEPDFFPKSAQGQYPKVLWIGCADSRVPESVVTGSRPGDIFVHRNIANQFHLHDDSALSVLTYAIKVVGVEHVVIVGHTKCGGAIACYDAAKEAGTNSGTELGSESPINRWLAPLTKLAGSLDLPSDANEAVTVLVKENVKVQVANVCKAEPVVSSWAHPEKRKPVTVHGWLYDVETGRIEDLNITQTA